MPKIGTTNKPAQPPSSPKQSVKQQAAPAVDKGYLWIPVSLTVKLWDGKRHNIKGLKLGTMLLHTSPDDQKVTWVTHLPSGYRVIYGMDREACKLVAQVCHIRLREVLLHNTKDAVRAAAPAWVKPWLEECARKSAFVDPPAE